MTLLDGGHSAAFELVVRQQFLHRLDRRIGRKRPQQQRARTEQHPNSDDYHDNKAVHRDVNDSKDGEPVWPARARLC